MSSAGFVYPGKVWSFQVPKWLISARLFPGGGNLNSVAKVVCATYVSLAVAVAVARCTYTCSYGFEFSTGGGDGYKYSTCLSTFNTSTVGATVC